MYSSSIQFLTLTEKYIQNYKIKVKKSISKFSELEQLSNEEKNILFVIKFRENDNKNFNKITDYLLKNNIDWICINSNEDFNKTFNNNALKQLYLSERPSGLAFKLFLKNLSEKIIEYYKIIDENLEISSNENTELNYKKVITIGASTGGTDAVEDILKSLPENVPPILVVIHMPPNFTNLYAERLNEICKMEIKEAKDGDKLKSGVALIAPGGMQMRIRKDGNHHYVSCIKEGKINGHQPSVNALFESAANVLAPNLISVILTGMGDDGAEGLLKIRKNGGYTIGQDESSSVVYGMPKVAYDIGAVFIQAALKDISRIIQSQI